MHTAETSAMRGVHPEEVGHVDVAEKGAVKISAVPHNTAEGRREVDAPARGRDNRAATRPIINLQCRVIERTVHQPSHSLHATTQAMVERLWREDVGGAGEAAKPPLS